MDPQNFIKQLDNAHQLGMQMGVLLSIQKVLSHMERKHSTAISLEELKVIQMELMNEVYGNKKETN